jgi:hypothetical protein
MPESASAEIAAAARFAYRFEPHVKHTAVKHAAAEKHHPKKAEKKAETKARHRKVERKREHRRRRR